MKKALTMMLLAAVSCATVACATHTPIVAPPALEDVAPFPEAKAGQKRHVIWLAERHNEDLLRVELAPGQVMQTDCNTRGLMATLTSQDLTGFGYTYYEVSDVKGPIATMMACPEGSEEKEDFVAAHGHEYSLNYNSKLPIVVYAPQDLEVRYRIWTGDKKLQSATVE